jgi:5-bromo-4-chloroindolyl phosphate hydrolysis protein
MKRKIENMFYSATGIFTSSISFPLFLFGFNFSWWLSILCSITVGFISYKGLKWRSNNRFLKSHQMTKDEYTYIRAQIQKASGEIRIIQKSLFKVRSIENFKLARDMTKYVNLIQRTIVSNPKYFFRVEDFYYIHLPVASELLSEYLYLSKHPVITLERLEQLKQTRKTLYEISDRIESEWNHLLEERTSLLQKQVYLANANLNIRTNPSLNLFKEKNEIDG